MNNSYITIIKEKRTALSRKRIPLNQNGCTANFRIGVPFEQNLQSKIEEDIKDHISSKATVRHESPPGDQAQFDWSPYNVPVDGVIITVYCFSMILSASRKKAVCFSLKADAAAIYEAIQELFEDLSLIHISEPTRH